WTHQIRHRQLWAPSDRDPVRARRVEGRRQGSALSLQAGPGHPARRRPDIGLCREIARNREAAQEAGVFAAAVGVDAERWKFSRILLSEKEPTGGEQGMVYQVLYLAKPLLKELPKVAREPELAS